MKIGMWLRDDNEMWSKKDVWMEKGENKIIEM